MRKTTSILLVGFCVVGLVLGLLLSKTKSTNAINQRLLETGIEVYRANYCGSCHTLTIANTRGMFAPDHDDIVAQAMIFTNSEAYTGNAETVEEYIYESIVEPAIFYTPGYESSNHHMPAFSHLSDEELTAMVYMLMHQSAVE